MILTLQEIMDTCDDWIMFCQLHGYSEWAVNEGGGDVMVHLTIQQAHHLGIVKKIPASKGAPFNDVYPDASNKILFRFS